MGAIFSPKTPKPDPAALEAERRARERAERQAREATQEELTQATAQRTGQFGRRSLYTSGETGYRQTLGG